MAEQDDLVRAARESGMSVGEEQARMPAGGDLQQIPKTEPIDLNALIGNFLMKAMAPNARSLMSGEPPPPMAPLPATPGKVPSTQDPRQMGAAIEGLQNIPALAGPGAGEAFAGRMMQPALAGAERMAPALAKSRLAASTLAAGNAGQATTPAAAEGAAPAEEVPVGERPKTGEWWRTKREPPPQMPPFQPPTMHPDELAPYQDPAWNKPRGWQGDQEARQNSEGPVAHATRVADLRKQRSERENKRISASENKTAVARQEYEKERERRMFEYQKEQERIDKLDAEYKSANENFRRKHPELATALPVIGAAAGAALPYGNRVRLQRINNKLVTDFDKAIERAEAAAQNVSKGAGVKAEKAGAVSDLEKRLDPQAPAGLARSRAVEPTVGGQIGSSTMGALGSVEGALLPYELDLALPMDSPDKREAMNPVNWAERAGQQALPGALAGHVGGHMPLPRRGMVPDVERAQGLMRRLQAPAAPPRKTKPVVQTTTPEQDQLQAIQAALGVR